MARADVPKLLGWVLRIPAIVVSLGGMALTITAMLEPIVPTPAYVIALGTLHLLLIAWPLAAHDAAARKLGEATSPTVWRLAAIVLGVGISGIAAQAIGWSPPEHLKAPIAVAGALSFFAIFWLAGCKLALATSGKAGDLAFGLFVAILCLPIGIWFLRRRVEIVLANA